MGDDNTAFFHRSLKLQNYRRKVYALNDRHGIWCEGPDQVAEAFIDYYKALLGSEMTERVKV